MSGTAFAVLLLALCVGVLLGGKYMYLLYVRIASQSILRKNGLRMEDVKLSFDRMVFAVPLPTNQPDILEPEKHAFQVVEDFGSWVYPRLRGISVLLKPSESTKHLIAYLSIEQFRLPLLDQLLTEGRIDRESYKLISSCMLTDPSSKTEIVDEVYRQIHSKRFF